MGCLSDGSRSGFNAGTVTDRENFRISMETLFSNQISMLDIIHRSYAYDGPRDRFLMIRELGVREIPAELILVQNFMEEVRARLGG